jgi:hypothetical protein
MNPKQYETATLRRELTRLKRFHSDLQKLDPRERVEFWGTAGAALAAIGRNIIEIERKLEAERHHTFPPS